ncbi:putative pectinesterase 11 [Syzygium oleosum]|uniref:putative pectinesterase 11 n=1 Tax=Syzygium oleosum TaxID=219896 RepID=UPI0011D2830D|nr:putative pectinesterase 11 [Syzygium oleosum]
MRNPGQFILYFLLALLPTCTSFSEAGNASRAPSVARLVRVDPSGEGDFTKIQDAIDAVQSNNLELVFIRVEPGTYREKIVVPADKPFVTLSGRSGDIFGSPTVSVLASDFVGRYLTIQNTHGPGAKAVALRVSGDRAVFLACRITSHQDTLLDDAGRHYYSNCYIEGDVDFIFGDAASLFEKCQVHSVSQGGGTITAQRRASPSENTGFVFLGCTITGLADTFLGRPWGPYSRVVFALSYMSSAVLPQGWDDWGDPSNQRTAYYGQYKCYGPGANTSKRVPWSRFLTSEEASPFLTADMVDRKSWFRNAPSIFN